MNDSQETPTKTNVFDFSAFPENTVFHERRLGRDRRDRTPLPQPEAEPEVSVHYERREKKERRKRIDPTTFEKQYTDDELEFMNAMQRFKEQTGRPFPTYGEVLRVACDLGYRRLDGLGIFDEPDGSEAQAEAETVSLASE